jgi:hypothetical protein
VLLRAGESVLVAAVQDPRPHLLVSDALWGDGGDVLARSALAMTLVRALRSLAGWDPDPVAVPPERAVSDPLHVQDDAVTTMPGSRSASAVAPIEQASQAAPTRRSFWPSLTGALLGLALVAFVVEAALHARGRIP